MTVLREKDCFSIMDLQSGYWQVPIKEADHPKTAFLTADGLYQFRVMAMGLCPAPGTFPRMMDVVLSLLKWSTCLVYLDDIIVHSRTFEEHVNGLRIMLDRLRSANLIVKLEKCEFARPTLKALGHIVDKHGISPNPEKIRAVRDFPLPPLEGSNAKKSKGSESVSWISVVLQEIYRRICNVFYIIRRAYTCYYSFPDIR